MRRLVSIIVIFACSLALAEEGRIGDAMPAPPDGWWMDVRPGDSATYAVNIGENKMFMIITVEEVEGPEITVSTQTYRGERMLPKEMQTVNAEENPEAAAGGVPEGARVTRLADSTIDVSGQPFEVTEYRVEHGGMTMRVWHSDRLPRIFSGGNVRMLTSVGGTVTDILLIEFRPGE